MKKKWLFWTALGLLLLWVFGGFFHAFRFLGSWGLLLMLAAIGLLTLFSTRKQT